jgi:hypothetical protein
MSMVWRQAVRGHNVRAASIPSLVSCSHVCESALASSLGLDAKCTQLFVCSFFREAPARIMEDSTPARCSQVWDRDATGSGGQGYRTAQQCSLTATWQRLSFRDQMTANALNPHVSCMDSKRRVAGRWLQY